MPWPFKRKATKTPFGRALLSVREAAEAEIATHPEIEDPNRIVLLSASAGATVALGGFGTVLIDNFGGEPALLPGPHGETITDPIVAFANRLSQRPASIEPAYRVVTWALVTEFAVFHWKPNYELEMHECATAFEFRNELEGEIAALGEPVAEEHDAEVDRLLGLHKGSLANMIAAAIDRPVSWGDPFVGMHLPAWQEQFQEGMSTAVERMKQLAPTGLPIWET